MWPRLVFAIAVLLLATPRRADACSCRQPGDPATELAKSDAVFEGTVTSIDASGSSFGTGIWSRARELLGMEPRFDDYGKKVHFSVSRSWKGVARTTGMLSTGFGGGDCGYGFVQGSSYVVYAYQTDSGFATGICSRTDADT